MAALSFDFGIGRSFGFSFCGSFFSFCGSYVNVLSDYKKM